MFIASANSRLDFQSCCAKPPFISLCFSDRSELSLYIFPQQVSANCDGPGSIHTSRSGSLRNRRLESSASSSSRLSIISNQQSESAAIVVVVFFFPELWLAF